MVCSPLPSLEWLLEKAHEASREKVRAEVYASTASSTEAIETRSSREGVPKDKKSFGDLCGQVRRAEGLPCMRWDGRGGGGGGGASTRAATTTGEQTNTS